MGEVYCGSCNLIEVARAHPNEPKNICSLCERIRAQDAQIAQMQMNYDEYVQQREMVNELVVYMREQYAEEILAGHHREFKSIVDAAIYYLGRERRFTEKRKSGLSGKLYRMLDRWFF